MKNTHQVYLISDSTGETLDRIFMALKAQFNNFDYDLNQFSFTRTENQISTILTNAKKQESPIILYTVVNSKLAKFLAEEANKKVTMNKRLFILNLFIILPSECWICATSKHWL